MSKRCEYGIKAAARLAKGHGEGYLQSREIAESEGMPAKFLESVLLGLRSAALLESKVGAGGGYRLSRPPEQIRVSEIVAALEPESTVTATSERISIGQTALDIFQERSNTALDEVVGSLSLDQLVHMADARVTSDDDEVSRI
ncbi:MAG: Rrf2 family transcriptional regulator [Phycisphaerales bacterium]|nr:Rrf2 family transcriptional regulator [Phycisphaerales bacterium]